MTLGLVLFIGGIVFMVGGGFVAVSDFSQTDQVEFVDCFDNHNIKIFGQVCEKGSAGQQALAMLIGVFGVCSSFVGMLIMMSDEGYI